MGIGNISGSSWEEQMTAFLDGKRTSSAEDHSEILYSYVGIIDQDKVHAIVSEIEQLLLGKHIPKGKVKKSFNILVEGLQNMAIHSEVIGDQRTVGLELTQRSEDIHIRILGIADEKALTKVKVAVDELNQMDRTEIKRHYLGVMDNGIISPKGGAGLGLITMVMKSTNGMEVESLEGKDGLYILAHHLQV